MITCNDPVVLFLNRSTIDLVQLQPYKPIHVAIDKTHLGNVDNEPCFSKMGLSNEYWLLISEEVNGDSR